MTMQKTYTVFTAEVFQTNYGGYSGPTLQELIDRYVADFSVEYGTLIAWAPEGVAMYGGNKHHRVLRAESIAAGRVIKLIDGKYVPFESGSQLETCLVKALAKRWRALERAEAEPTRPRLTWADTEPFDAFKGYAVDKSGPQLPPEGSHYGNQEPPTLRIR